MSAIETLYEAIKATGKAATKEHGDARLKVCKTLNNGQPCEFSGMVPVVPKVQVEGCTKCGCFFATKPYMVTNFLGEVIKCPHPDGNKWDEVDKFFLI